MSELPKLTCKEEREFYKENELNIQELRQGLSRRGPGTWPQPRRRLRKLDAGRFPKDLRLSVSYSRRREREMLNETRGKHHLIPKEGKGLGFHQTAPQQTK